MRLPRCSTATVRYPGGGFEPFQKPCRAFARIVRETCFAEISFAAEIPFAKDSKFPEHQHGNAASVTMILAAIGSASGNQQTSSDNGGTLIVDSESTPQCYKKSHYRGDPHEFGAFGDGSHDDTPGLQAWLGAYCRF